MRAEEFNQIIENKIADIQKVLVKKAGEYAQDGDRLHNFKQAAHLQEVSLREALGGMMVKHTVSVYDMINNPTVDYPQDLWEEKIGDHLNYLLLLLAVVWEEKNAQADTAEDASSDEPLAEWEIQAANGEFPISDSPKKSVDELPRFATWKEFTNRYGMDQKVTHASNVDNADILVRGIMYKLEKETNN